MLLLKTESSGKYRPFIDHVKKMAYFRSTSFNSMLANK